MNKIYTDENPRIASAQERSSDRREVAERRQSVPWVVDSNDRRSGIDRRTGLDRRGNRVVV